MGGLIPARAGKTRTAWLRSWACPAHPRAGRENPTFSAIVSNAAGSSPRGRGKLMPACRGRATSGLIPARAGKTRRPSCASCRTSAHPRAGGENVVAETKNFSRAGSSPRGRGKRGNGGDHEEDRRLIPARAGKTSRRSAGYSARRAHPRAGGENLRGFRDPCEGGGSSPRGRGKRKVAADIEAIDRLIPARAGKTGPYWPC